MAYASLDELRDWVGIPEDDDLDDTKLTLALAAAEGLIDAYTGQYFTADGDEVESYWSSTDGRIIDVAPISSVTGLVVATDNDDDGTYETTWDTADYRLAPENAAPAGRPWTRIIAVGQKRFPVVRASRLYPGVRVTARGGWPAVPAEVKQATLIQAAFLWGRKDSKFGVAGSPEFGNELRVETDLDRTARALLRHVRRTWWVI